MRSGHAGLRESGNGSTLDGNQSSQVPSNFDVEPVRGRAAPELSVGSRRPEVQVRSDPSSMAGTPLDAGVYPESCAIAIAVLGPSALSESEYRPMHDKLSHVDGILARIAQLAGELKNDPDGHVRRSIDELREAFTTRGAMEPAVARVRHSIDVLRAGDLEGARREFQHRAPGLNHLSDVIEQELLPDLRRLGFDL